MDPRAERAVHDQMVAITCRAEAGQYVAGNAHARYFLITPKLLSGLRYHELMKVLLINNGDWLPEKLICTSRLSHSVGCGGDQARTTRKRCRGARGVGRWLACGVPVPRFLHKH